MGRVRPGLLLPRSNSASPRPEWMIVIVALTRCTRLPWSLPPESSFFSNARMAAKAGL